MPCPPPMHSVTRPRLRPSRRIEWMSFVVSTAPVAPIGWPWATAPPSTLTMSSGNPSSRATTMAMAAKASLISDALDRADVPAGPLQRLSDRRDRPKAEHAGLDCGDAVGDKARRRANAALIGPGLVGKHHRGGGVVQSGRIAGGDGAIRPERRLEPRQRFQRRVGPVGLVLVELRRSLLPGTSTGTICDLK